MDSIIFEEEVSKRNCLIEEIILASDSDDSFNEETDVDCANISIDSSINHNKQLDEFNSPSSSKSINDICNDSFTSSDSKSKTKEVYNDSKEFYNEVAFKNYRDNSKYGNDGDIILNKSDYVSDDDSANTSIDSSIDSVVSVELEEVHSFMSTNCCDSLDDSSCVDKSKFSCHLSGLDCNENDNSIIFQASNCVKNLSEDKDNDSFDEDGEKKESSFDLSAEKSSHEINLINNSVESKCDISSNKKSIGFSTGKDRIKLSTTKNLYSNLTDRNAQFSEVKKNNTCRKIDFSSDSDDDFENFIAKIKSNTEKKKNRQPLKQISPINNFIKYSSSESEEEGFHLNVNHKIDEKISDGTKSASIDTPEPVALVFSTPENSIIDQNDCRGLEEKDSTNKVKYIELEENCNNDFFENAANLTLDNDVFDDKPPIDRYKTPMRIDKNIEADDFLASLSPSVNESSKCALVKPYLKNFKAKKQELAQKLFNIFNENVFRDQLPEDMEIKWKPRLTKTAGLCRCRRSQLATAGRTATIELSTKVIDSAYRLRDTLLHEMCHAATWIIYGFQDGHGKLWRFWAQEAVRVFPRIPKPTVCHSYEINTKYSYKCELCGSSIGRHSKSIDIDKKRCGRCGGKFELLTPKPLRTPSKFALFVKENYGSVKKSNQKSKHGEIMRMLSSDFSKKTNIND